VLGLERITFDPEVKGGRACIRGLRITVSLILNLIANGMREDEILEAYPYLEPRLTMQPGWPMSPSTPWSARRREVLGRYGYLSAECRLPA
jgi:hypothetical protein